MTDTMPELTAESLVREIIKFSQRHGYPARTLVATPDCEENAVILLESMTKTGTSSYDPDSMFDVVSVEIRTQEVPGTWYLEG